MKFFLPYPGTYWIKSTTRAIRESVFGLGKKVHSKIKNSCSSKNVRSTLSTNAGVSRTVSRLHPSSKYLFCCVSVVKLII